MVWVFLIWMKAPFRQLPTVRVGWLAQMKGRIMQKRAMSLATAVLIALAGCGGSDQGVVTGQWSLTLHPAGQSVSHPEAVTVERLYLNEDHGQLSGRSDAFTFSGQRRGNVLALTVFAPGASGPAVEHSYLTLTLSGDNSVRGSGYTPVPGAADGSASPSRLDYEVSGQQVSAMSPAQANAEINPPNVGGTSANVLHTVCTIFSAAESFAMGYITGNAFRPMGGCIMAHSGGGYYVFGRDAPGSLLPIWTQNAYVPVEWATCTARDYKFNFSYKGQAFLTTGVEFIANSKHGVNYLPGLDLLKVDGKSLTDLAVELDDLRVKYGNYALLVAKHNRTGFVGLYVIRERGNSEDFKNEAIIKTLAGNLHASVKVGKDLTETFSLRRGPVPAACLDQVEFAYLLGSADVTLD